MDYSGLGQPSPKCLPDIVQRSMLASAYVACSDIYRPTGAGGHPFRCKWTSAYAELLRYPDYDSLVFKGSWEMLDWIINLSALPPVPYLGGWAHLGFAIAHASIWGQIQQHLRYSRPLLITGHSLGGVMADYSASAVKTHSNAHLIAFGKPNGWLRLAPIKRPWLKTNLSVVSGSDIVTRLPRFCYGPDQGQDMLYLPNAVGKDWYVINPERSFRLLDFKLGQAITDHGMAANYSAGVSEVLRHWPEAA
jgi:hypothetical protein